MALSNTERLVNSGMVPGVAKEVTRLVDEATALNPDVAGLDPVATADATDLASAVALANANKAKINEIIAALQA
jgi:hypothetical protein